MYRNVCNKNRKLKKKIKISCIFKKTYFLKKTFPLFTASVVINIKKTFKEEESIEILKILGLINNIEEFQKIYNYA